mmetsp:Transcript_21021/g.58313  ORF Transcript_21021/g.58313 Transcript_21021/m.58313 type:complete len:204 (+) Transcript_21021:555-1166(+)
MTSTRGQRRRRPRGKAKRPRPAAALAAWLPTAAAPPSLEPALAASASPDKMAWGSTPGAPPLETLVCTTWSQTRYLPPGRRPVGRAAWRLLTRTCPMPPASALLRQPPRLGPPASRALGTCPRSAGTVAMRPAAAQQAPTRLGWPRPGGHKGGNRTQPQPWPWPRRRSQAAPARGRAARAATRWSRSAPKRAPGSSTCSCSCS